MPDYGYVDSDKALHDLLLANKPEGAVHDSDSCEFCQESTSGQQVVSTQGGVPDVSTVTQEDISKAVEAAVAPLNEELDTLRKFKADVESSEAAQAQQAKIEEAETKAEELQNKLDESVIEATEAKKSYEDLVAWLEAEAEAKAEAERIEAVKAERVEKVRELNLFKDSYIEENADRYAAMSEEAFETAVADWKAAAEAKKEDEGSEEELPTSTAFVATRDDAGETKKSHLSVMRLRNEGHNLRKIR